MSFTWRYFSLKRIFIASIKTVMPKSAFHFMKSHVSWIRENMPKTRSNTALNVQSRCFVMFDALKLGQWSKVLSIQLFCVIFIHQLDWVTLRNSTNQLHFGIYTHKTAHPIAIISRIAMCVLKRKKHLHNVLNRTTMTYKCNGISNVACQFFCVSCVLISEFFHFDMFQYSILFVIFT